MPVKQTGGIYINGSERFGGGIIVDLNISVDLEKGSTASVTVIPDDCDADLSGGGDAPQLSASRYDTHRIGVSKKSFEDYEGEADQEVFSADFNLIEKRTESGTRGTLYKYEFQEAGPLYLSRAQVVIKGVHVPEDYGSGGADIMAVGKAYFTSAVQGALIAKDAVSDDAEEKLLSSSLLRDEAQVKATQFLFTGKELAETIRGAGIPMTTEAEAALVNGAAGMMFSNGGPLINVLNEIGGTLGIVFVWTSYDGKGNYIHITSADEDQVETFGISILGSQTATASASTASAPIIQSSSSESLRGTFAQGASYRIEVMPDDPLNQRRGIGTFITASIEKDTQLNGACSGKKELLGSDYFRDDGTPKELSEDQFEKLVHYTRFVNALSLGPEFFRFYVYAKLIAHQRRYFSDNEDWNKTDLIKKNPLGRNRVIEQLFSADADNQGCIKIASAEFWGNDGGKYATEQMQQARGGNVAKSPWLNINAISAVVKQGAENNVSMLAAGIKNFDRYMALAYIKEDEGDSNLTNDATLSNYYKALIDSLAVNEREYLIARGPRDVYCEKKQISTPTSGGLDDTQISTSVKAAWRQDTTFYSNPTINKINPWLVIPENDPWYVLVKSLATEADFKKFKEEGYQLTYVIAVAFILGAFGSLVEAAETGELDCPDKQKTLSETKDNKPDSWACNSDSLELLPDGVLGLTTVEGFETLSKEKADPIIAKWLSYFSDEISGSDNLELIQRAKNDGEKGVAVIMMPAFGEGDLATTNMEYSYYHDKGLADETVYEVRTEKFEVEQDLIDKDLDDLDFKPSDVSKIKGSRKYAFSEPGELKYYYGINLAGAGGNALSVSNKANDAELGEAFGDTRELDKWSKNIKAIQCDGKVKQGAGDDKDPEVSDDTAEIALSQSVLGGKGFIITSNLQAKAQGASALNQSSSSSSTTTYAGVPDSIPGSHEGLQTLNFSMTPQGITTTVSMGNRSIAISFKKMTQFTTLRNHLIAAGYDSVTDAFGTKFRANTFDPITIPNQGFTASRPAGSNPPF